MMQFLNWVFSVSMLKINMHRSGLNAADELVGSDTRRERKSRATRNVDFTKIIMSRDTVIYEA